MYDGISPGIRQELLAKSDPSMPSRMFAAGRDVEIAIGVTLLTWGRKSTQFPWFQQDATGITIMLTGTHASMLGDAIGWRSYLVIVETRRL